MGMTYIRRFRMQFDLARTRLADPLLPEEYRWVRWSKPMLERHAGVKHDSFRFEIDSLVFPCLGDIDGCRRLMLEITEQKLFVAHATWLISYEPDRFKFPTDCGTIQGIAQSKGVGAVQNVGVVPEHRGIGLGRALVLKSLQGFRRAGLKRVFLEVTAENEPAVDLYRSVGFRLTRTMYKSVGQDSLELEPIHI